MHRPSGVELTEKVFNELAHGRERLDGVPEASPDSDATGPRNPSTRGTVVASQPVSELLAKAPATPRARHLTGLRRS